MKPFICALLLLVSTVVRLRVSLQLEIVALRHQLAVYQRTTKRPPISSGDRILWSYTPISHPFVERLIASMRREFLDQTLFWTDIDLERKLLGYQQYFNHHRTHRGLDGAIPVCTEAMAINLNDFRWQHHCRGLFEPPVAA
jgi:hypothetical protein